MTTINPYITFDGNCEEAFNFYKSVFGGEFQFIGRMSEMPEKYQVPDDQKNRVMHVSLPISKETTLMGSDTVEGLSPPIAVGNNFSISIATDSKEEADRVFRKLFTGGVAIMPMEDTFWGSYFGMCVDSFGIQWMVNFATEENN